MAGEMGQAAGEALAKQMKVGAFFRAADFVPVRTVHVMADIEALVDPGLRFLEETAAGGGRFRVPVTTNPRSVDFSLWREVGQEEEEMIKERRIVDALTSMGALPCNTCINYQTVDPPRFGEHLGWGDTGTVIFANSVAGARSNFEAGPAAVWPGSPAGCRVTGFTCPNGGAARCASWWPISPARTAIGARSDAWWDARWATTGRYRYLRA